MIGGGPNNPLMTKSLPRSLAFSSQVSFLDSSPGEPGSGCPPRFIVKQPKITILGNQQQRSDPVLQLVVLRYKLDCSQTCDKMSMNFR